MTYFEDSPLPDAQVAQLHWTGMGSGRSQGISVEGIDDKKLLPRLELFGRHVRLVPGKHEIDFKSVHSSAFDTLVFVAEAGHSYQLRNHCLSLFSSDCHFWILDQTADLVVAGSFPEYLDRDLAARSVSAQTASDQARAFDERLARARFGQTEAQYDLAADYLAGFAAKGPDRVTAYAWLAAAARGGHEGAGKALRYLADRLTEAPPAPVGNQGAAAVVRGCATPGRENTSSASGSRGNTR